MVLFGGDNPPNDIRDHNTNNPQTKQTNRPANASYSPNFTVPQPQSRNNNIVNLNNSKIDYEKMADSLRKAHYVALDTKMESLARLDNYDLREGNSSKIDMDGSLHGKTSKH